VDTDTANQLLDINRQFYQTFALQFSQTRQRIQPGVKRVMENLPNEATILDLGCGNGELWRRLASQGYDGRYIGIDSSPGLLEIAAANIPKSCLTKPIFILVDLASSNWQDCLFDSVYSSDLSAGFDFILAFAMLHHLPGRGMRLNLLRKVNQLVSPNGYFIHSEWLFLNSAKLRSRLQPWNRAGLSEDRLDEGDYLLDWRRGGSGLRYVHLFDTTELNELATESNFQILGSFTSDGEGGNLSLYQIWTAVK